MRTTFHHRRLAAATALLALLGLAGPLAAHDFWVVPSSFRPSADGPLAVRLKVGERLLGDPVPRDRAQIERFALIGPSGETPIAGPEGAEPAGFAHVGGAGLYWVVYDGAPNRLDLPAEKFEEALRKEGLERISELRASRGESGRPSRELFSRCAKALLRVGPPGSSGSPRPGSNAGRGPAFDRPLGLELELVPERDPSLPLPGGDLPVRLLFRGKPLAGALVVALDSRHADGSIAARTGRDGRVRLTLPEGGFWLVKAVHMIPAGAGAGVDWESLWASLTFALPDR